MRGGALSKGDVGIMLQEFLVVSEQTLGSWRGEIFGRELWSCAMIVGLKWWFIGLSESVDKNSRVFSG